MWSGTGDDDKPGAGCIRRFLRQQLERDDRITGPGLLRYSEQSWRKQSQLRYRGQPGVLVLAGGWPIHLLQPTIRDAVHVEVDGLLQLQRDAGDAEAQDVARYGVRLQL